MPERTYTVAVAERRQSRCHRDNRGYCLDFRRITADALPEISRILHKYPTSRTCDYTIGGIFMWIRFFGYEYCIVDDTLFIRGDLENRKGDKAFSLPVGRMPIDSAIYLLKQYCNTNCCELKFSAIPEDRLDDFRNVGLSSAEELRDWADYLYDAESLATLGGRKLSKKRNHYNRFVTDNPGFFTEDIHFTDPARLSEAYSSWLRPEDIALRSAAEEHEQTSLILDSLGDYPFDGITLHDGKGNIVGFTIGEVIRDTLYVHIEKINKDCAGAGESINKLFVEKMLKEHPQLKFVNREEDTGDEGLRRAKESYHPLLMLRKFNVWL